MASMKGIWQTTADLKMEGPREKNFGHLKEREAAQKQ